MKKRKKMTITAVILVTLLGIGCCHPFIGGRMIDGSSEAMAGEDGTRSPKQTDRGDEAGSERMEPEEITNITRTEGSLGSVTEGTEEYRGFVIDNVFHSASEGDIHYNVYIPESYDGSEPYALYFTLPGYEGLYFQGVAANLQSEEFGFEAQKYNEKMIIVAPQPGDWGETSANQTIALVEYFLDAYNIDRGKVYGSGFSGGGETMSQVLGKRPDLFTAYLQVSSQWDGAYEPVAAQRLPVYFAIGQGDEYYGPEPTREAYDTLYALYEQQGLTEAEIDELLVLDIKEHSYFTERGMSNEHGGGGLFAYDEEIMGWLFSRNEVAESEETVVEWTKGPGINAEARLPGSGNGGTVLTTAADAHDSQTLYLWEEGNVPATTEYTENNGNYSDGPDFRPYLVSFPVPEGTEVKGAVLICAGGAFQYRSDENEGTPVAEELSGRGYQSFVVNYRLRPYTQEEGALDLARAVRFVRKNADVYGIDEDDIAVMGFSAGGILAGEMLLNFDGLVNGTALDADYVPDALDEISADAAADGMIYSFYGRLSVGSTDVEMLRGGDLPPTFYCYGTRDPFYEQFLANADAVEAAGVRVERLELEGRPHGFGYREGWFDAYDSFLMEVFGKQIYEEEPK